MPAQDGSTPGPVEIERLERALRASGARMAVGRRRILREIANLQGHISAGEIHRRLTAGGSEVDASTVYRTVETLCEVGLLRRTHVHNGVIWYHHADVPLHQHLLCRVCGDDRALDLDEFGVLAETLLARHGFIVDLTRLRITGLCRDCAAP